MKHRTRSGRSAPVVAAAVVLGLLTSGALVWQASTAAFTATTNNSANTWTAGSIALSDNDSGSALFLSASYPNLKPGSTDYKCIDVTFTGNVLSTVKLYSSDPTGDLGEWLEMKIEEGPTTKACLDPTGWDSTLTAASQSLDEFYAVPHTTWVNGVGTWAPAVTATRRFKFTFLLRDNNNAMGDTTSVNYTWEARSS